jgi:hypothetical protein
MCSPVATVSHRWNVDWEIQRAPRVRNKTWTWFQVKVDNYDSSIWSLLTNIDYVVFNSWTYDFSWLQIQAWTSEVTTVACNSSNNPWTATNVNFTPNFSVAPSILHTISTENDSSWVISWVNANNWTRQSEPTISTMWLIQQRSFNSCTHDPENIDYIAFEPGHYNTLLWFEVDAVRSTDSITSITSTWDPINYYSPFSSTPWVALVSQLWEDWWNGWYWQIHIWWWVLADKLYATVDEDWPSADRNHTNEVFSSVAFSDNSWQFVKENIITYSIDSWNDSADFIINPNTWELQFITSKNPANPTDTNLDWIYEVTVSVCDNHCNSKCNYQSFNVDVSDTIAPIISSTNFSNNDILPWWIHDIILNYSDSWTWATWIDTTSSNMTFEKWNWTNWIANTNISNSITTTTQAIYTTNNIDFWKYKINFNISDNAWNTSLNSEITFYIDKPELIISTWSINIWELNNATNTFWETITVTVKTVWTPFRVKLMKSQNLEWNSWEFIPYHDWTIWMWYDKNDDWDILDFNDDIVGQEILNINIDWNLNTYTYTVKMWAIVEYQQAWWDYSWKIDFGIELDY